MYLVDTNILSTTAPGRNHGPAQPVAEWLAGRDDVLFLSVMTIAEIEDGIAKARRQGATRKAAALADWLDAVLDEFADQVLPVTPGVARKAGQFLDAMGGSGLNPGLADMLIAATAAHFELVLLSRNVRDFAGLGVPVVDPFEALPG
jgi:toxin FitB